LEIIIATGGEAGCFYLRRGSFFWLSSDAEKLNATVVAGEKAHAVKAGEPRWQRRKPRFARAAVTARDHQERNLVARFQTFQTSPPLSGATILHFSPLISHFALAEKANAK